MMYVCAYVCMYVCIGVCMYVGVNVCIQICSYGVATISRLLKIIGLFCRISSFLWGSVAKET